MVHPKLTRAIAEQSSRLIHTSNLYRIGEQEALADQARGDKAAPTARSSANSGCESQRGGRSSSRACTATAREWRVPDRRHGQGLPRQDARDALGHGHRKVQQGFEPLVPGFVRVPFNDIESVRQVAAHDRNVVAVLVEPIQGEGGINISTMQYLRDLRELCDRQGWFLMVDEVQCGLGRTGKWFVYQHAGIQPDVVLLAKGLASGVPIGACLARGTAAGVFQTGDSRLTFRWQSPRLRSRPRDARRHRGRRSHE